MKIYIFADIEGCSGVYAREQVLPGEGRFSEGRACMTADSMEKALFASL